MPKVRILIADDQQLLRRSPVHLLDSQPGFRVVAEAVTGIEAISLARELVPDVVLVDIHMPQLDRIVTVRSAVRDPHLFGVRVLMLTMFDLDECTFGALCAGASGFLLEGTTPEALINVVRIVSVGQALLAPSTIITPVGNCLPDTIPSGRAADLTPRRTEILGLMARGLSNDQVERELCISYATYKTHISALLSRLQARGRAQLVIVAYEHGLVRPGT